MSFSILTLGKTRLKRIIEKYNGRNKNKMDGIGAFVSSMKHVDRSCDKFSLDSYDTRELGLNKDWASI